MPVFKLEKEPIFPHPEYAEESGLLAIGGDLTTERLIEAYTHGIFPWYAKGEPVMWWSPDPRMVLYINQFKVSKSLIQFVRNNKFQVKFDTDFRQVIESCANIPRFGQKDTWITHDMINAYTDLHTSGYAHSVEIYEQNQLVGGLYGVSLGLAFFGESMFYVKKNASKVAFYHLVERLKKWKFIFIDAQIETAHLKSFGAKNIARSDFIEQLGNALKASTRKGKW